MLYIDNTCTDAWFNLAAEEYLLKNCQEDIFMLWQSEPAVVIGKHQDVWAEVNTELTQEKQISIARRFSGGGAVYHDLGNMNLTFIENSNRIDSVRFTESIIDFLKTLGIHAVSDERQGLTIDGLKISGCAQAIHKRRMLHHATLLFSTDLDLLTRSLQLSSEPSGNKKSSFPYSVKSVRSPVTNLSNHLIKPISIEVLKKLLTDYFVCRNTNSRSYKFNEHDQEMIRLLRNEKYATQNWIFNTYNL